MEVNRSGATPLNEKTSSSRFSRRLIFFLVVVALLMSASGVWLFHWRTAVGRENWFLHPNLQLWSPGAWAFPLVALVLFGGLAFLSAYDRCFRSLTPSAQRASRRLAIGALMLLSVVWNWSLLGPGTLPNGRGGVYNGTYSLIANGFSDVATHYPGEAFQIVGARAWTRDFASHQTPSERGLAHVATHPPGAVLFFFGCRRLLEKVPALRSFVERSAQRALGDSVQNVASAANQMRAVALNSALPEGAAKPSGSGPLPVSAVAVIFLAAAILSMSAAFAVPAVYILARDCDLLSGESAASHDLDSESEGAEISSAAASSEGVQSEAARREMRGLLAASLWILAPVTSLFGFTIDALVALGAAWTLALASKYFNRCGAAWMIGAGAVWGAAIFLSFGALALGPIVILWAGARALRQSLLRQTARAVLYLAGGLGLIGLLLILCFPMQPWRIFVQAMAAHHYATLETRSYGPWIVLNFAFWAAFSGWPLAVAALLPRLERPFLARHALLGSTVLVLLILSVSGGVRGETERLWLLFVPALCVSAADFWSSEIKLRSSWWLLLPLLQAAQTLMMAAALAPLVRPFGF